MLQAWVWEEVKQGKSPITQLDSWAKGSAGDLTSISLAIFNSSNPRKLVAILVAPNFQWSIELGYDLFAAMRSIDTAEMRSCFSEGEVLFSDFSSFYLEKEGRKAK